MTRRLRALVVLCGLIAAATALLLSDRAPVLYERAVERALEVAADVRNGIGLDDSDIGRQDIPVGDQTIGHAILFAGVTFVAAFVFRRRARPWVVALGVFAASAAFEVVQPLLSWSRTQELHDVVANGLGALAGWLAVSLLLRIPRLRRSRSLAW